jgi:hypothetical protein
MKHSGDASAFIRSKGDAKGHAAPLSQAIKADGYVNKRIRLSGYIKSSGADCAVLWMRVDDADGILEFDNMMNRGVSGTSDWQKVAVVLDVPANAAAILFGPMLIGGGSAWFDDLQLEIVTEDEKVTKMRIKLDAADLAAIKKNAAARAKLQAQAPLKPLTLTLSINSGSYL